MRRKLLVLVAATGVFAGAAGFGLLATQAIAAALPGQGDAVAAQPQGAPGTPHVGDCPLLNGGAMPDLQVMEAHMDAVHGEGAWEQMGSWMGGAGAMAPAGTHGGMMGPGFGAPDAR